LQETIAIELKEVAPFKALAVRTRLTPDKSGTREAWRQLTEKVPLDDARLAAGPLAYVFIPQHQWAGKVDTLWVGLAVREFGDVPEGVEALEVSGGLCASARVHGNEAHMQRVYDELFAWLDRSPDYELDRREGVLGMETVPLEPVNALTIPYEAIETFDFTILYPVRRKTGA
jgi:predicted transcriptional regulator YdeE